MPFLLGASYILNAAAQPTVALVSPRAAATQYQSLIDWIELHDNMRFRNPPLILVVPTAIFKKRVNNEAEYGGEIVGAETDCRILLDERVSDIRVPWNAAVLVHELTHCKQDALRQKFACVDQREAEAFANQNRFLIENHLSPVLPQEAITKMAACEGGNT